LDYTSYVLTLKGSNRSQHLVDQSRALGLHLKLCLGIKGQDFTNDDFAKFAPTKQAEFLLGRRIGRNELACVLGHLKIYREFLDQTSASWCLVLEDDAEIDPGLLKLLRHTSEFPRNSIIHLAPQHNVPNFVLHTLAFEGGDRVTTINRVLDFVPRTHGYLIDRTAASVAIKFSKGDNFYFTADWPLNWIGKVKFWVTSETLVNTLEADLGSDIAQERVSLEKASKREPFMRMLSQIRFLNWVFNGLGITALYGKSLGIPFTVTYRRLFIMPLRQKRYMYQAK
jgi:GR25 family glycosyltransferase involved in LPS biosynthesis